MFDLTQKKVTVIGLARTARPLTKLLLRNGAIPHVTESNDSPALRELARELEALGAHVELGGHTNAAFDDTAAVIPSPGVSPRIAPIQRAAANGARILSELEYAAPFCSSRIVAVTGTNGKTTTTEWITAMIRACGHSVRLAGNNATPFSAAVLEEPAPLYMVLEISSYQLELIDTFRPWIGAILNITPDHLGRHGDFDAYAAAKLHMFRNYGVGDHAILNADDPILRERYSERPGAQTHWFSIEKPLDNGVWIDGDIIREGKTEIAHVDDIRIPGRHNLANALASLTVMRAGLFADKSVRRALYAFPGVEHRIETVATIDHVTYINDSKATNLASMRAALDALDRPVILIAGGEAKGEDFAPYRDLIREKVKTMITIGRDGPLFERAYAGIVPIHRAQAIPDALATARTLATRGDIVLLSPACASFDQYNNFEERGHHFKECVKELEASAVASHPVSSSCSSSSSSPIVE